ncbi:SdiA-regulated domain-containing protein [Neolewinella lacunae]|uniref:SdiA-regulated domain-containing protein n=1 Tax=Neolewinella lacunae TaxID=1517758 RepID=A0A923PQH2_9BACT|nr:SdiA-regulated domain-containing protein [Neolewinella lacunae]MBC6996680.1 SdiA-regulated domain-containing protein [Neolewinella lacunae]MDN3633455.1 SdiA-regulated domain-containing protein [Neolewinella lacunae]
MFRFLLFIPLLFAQSNAFLSAQSPSFAYDLDGLLLISDLPAELNEVSGLSVDPNQKNTLLMVQDELGKVYRVSSKTGEVLWATTFWKDGDYEDVEAVGNDIWVVKSTGTLYQISNAGQPEQHVEKYNTLLTEDNDVEGLAYDRAKNRLLLACKNYSTENGESKNGRYIFAFDLATKTLGSQPAFAIEQQAVQNFLSKCDQTAGHAQLCSFFMSRAEYDLAPSAIAVHPFTGQLFITSSVGKVLMVLESNGQISYLHKLNSDLLPQPEGLAFDAEGELYISTERRKDSPARFYRIPYRAR